MARVEANLTVSTGQGSDYLCSMGNEYTEIISSKQKVDNTNGFIVISTLVKSIGETGAGVGARLKGAKLIVLKNNSPVAVEVQFKTREWKDDSNIDQTNSVDLGPGSATTINVHLYKFTMTNAGGTSDGNLSGGTLLANGQATSVDRNVLKTVSASIDSSSVSSGEVVACFVENETNTDDINLRVQVLYHIN